MEVVSGALPTLLPKLRNLLAEEYKLQKEEKAGIIFLEAELKSMKAVLEDISEIPVDELPSQDKIWAREVRELSYDIEDKIDTFMVKVKGSEPASKHGFTMFIDRAHGSLMRMKNRRKISSDIRDIKSRVTEVHERRHNYKADNMHDKDVKIDPRAFVRYEDLKGLVGIDEARDELINILIEGNRNSMQQEKIVSIVGFGGLGKTTLASVVFEKLKAQFDCSAFISVSRTSDMDKLFKNMFYQLANSTASMNVIDELREFLQDKRYFIIIDDIWKISDWNMIKRALPDNNVEYRIVTTTRNFTVAELIGRPYKMKPLSPENSRLLMYGRIFGKEVKDKCPDEQLEEVSNRILNKCDGVPLAIITIASLLVSKGRSKLEWYNVYNSIGVGLEDSNTVENVRKVLSFSYYDMPLHLRTCLLYLSMFPEDYVIRKDRLIWLWIAEGFIQYGIQDKSLFETGESYFNDLINRSMIEPKLDRWSGMIKSCHVHDLVLDFICSLSSEENFVTIQNNVVHSFISEKVRRLSLQNVKASHREHEAKLLSKGHHVRSVIVFQSTIEYITTALADFSILRVLDLEGCNISQSDDIKYLGNLLHLRYLSLRDTEIDQLPKEIGNLQFLQMLDVCTSDWNPIPSLPSSIVRLTKLMCLHINEWTSVPEGIVRSLTTLEELSGLRIDCKGKMLEELAHLTELKVLGLTIRMDNSSDLCLERDGDVDKSMVECLNKLQKIRSLLLKVAIKNRKPLNLDGWVVTTPENLCSLQLQDPYLFATLPAWVKVNPSHLVRLSYLDIRVKRLPQEDLEILGRLPALSYLNLMVHHEYLGIIHGRFVVGACSFPCLVHCELWGLGGHVVFEQGAMSRLMDLQFDFVVQRSREINGNFDFGLGNLTSLQEVCVWLKSEGAGEQEVEEAKAVVRHTIEFHPNHPSFKIHSF